MEFHPNDLSDLDELTEEHLGFSALSEGLGFSKGKHAPHPASKRVVELPEDEEEEAMAPPPPSQNRARQMSFSGTGAVAAGPMRPAPNFTAQAKPSVSTAPASAAAKVLAAPAAPRWMRLCAFVLDTFFVLLPFSLAWFFSFGSESREVFLQDPRSPLGLFAVIFSTYFLLSESFGGQSLGKMALGLRVVEDDKYQKPTGLRYAVIRLALFVLSTLFFGLGLLASFWDAKRRPWHDRYSNSIVRRIA